MKQFDEDVLVCFDSCIIIHKYTVCKKLQINNRYLKNGVNIFLTDIDRKFKYPITCDK